MATVPYTLPCTMEVPFTATFLDAFSNPVAIVNPLVVTENANIAKVELKPVDGAVSTVSGLVVAAGTLGTTEFKITGTNKDGSSVTVSQGIIIVNGNAIDIKITFGTPVLKQ